MMKKMLVAAFLLPHVAFAQVPDTLYLYTGKVVCHIREVSDEAVKFSYPGEELLNTAARTLFSKAVLGSGRVIQGAERVEIGGERDWGKVLVATSEKDVSGLVRITEVNGKSVNTMIGAYGSLEKEIREAREEIRRFAARHFCHVALVTGDHSRDGRTNESFKWTTASIDAAIFTYPDLKDKALESFTFEDTRDRIMKLRPLVRRAGRKGDNGELEVASEAVRKEIGAYRTEVYRDSLFHVLDGVLLVEEKVNDGEAQRFADPLYKK